jgi:four helix bundle protein
MAGGYQQLVVWQKAMDLVTAVYLLTENFPKTEQFGLTSQMRRCAVSIPSNIAEGSKRSTKADFKNFLVFALGSGAELRNPAGDCQKARICEREVFWRNKHGTVRGNANATSAYFKREGSS